MGVLIAHLMTVVENNGLSFSLIEDKIFKDQVSFEVHSASDQDEISMKFFASYIEIKFLRSLCDERDLPVGEICSNVRQIIEMSILRSLVDLHYNYNNLKPVMSLRCMHCSELHEVKKGKSSHKIYCEVTRTNSYLPFQGRCWYNEGQ
jgi:hypothetical protein